MSPSLRTDFANGVRARGEENASAIPNLEGKKMRRVEVAEDERYVFY